MSALIYISALIERHHRPRKRSRLALFMEIKTTHHERDHFITRSQSTGSDMFPGGLYLVGKKRTV